MIGKTFRHLTRRALSSMAWVGFAAAYVALTSTLGVGAASLDELVDITRGGAFYDNWYAALEKPAPTTTQPSYPAAGSQSGAVTWRCKECHGWDYRGAAGAYGSGSHFTGIKGISGMVGMDPANIERTIRDGVHRYAQEMLTDSAVAKLALFVSRGQIDMGPYIDRITKKALGDSGRGVQLYRMACYVCHGPNGKSLNFGSESEPEYVGTIARDNPWELLHKIRNGQPGVSMVALSGVSSLSIEDQVDILSYAQTLPAK